MCASNSPPNLSIILRKAKRRAEQPARRGSFPPCNERLHFYNSSVNEEARSADLLRSIRGCSSVVERHVANVAVVGSSPITRFLEPSRLDSPTSFLGFSNF